MRSLEFLGTSRRSDFWWFVLSLALILAVTHLMAQRWGLLIAQISALLVIVPWIAACTRRL
ncbi:MAG: hypothetical protein AAGJ52_06480 [Pseudomonadota bacterium]